MTPERSADAVLLDLHGTLVRPGPAHDWLASALAHLGRPQRPEDLTPDGDRRTALHDGLDRIWERATEVDPTSTRDLDAAAHRSVFGRLVADLPGLDDDLVAGLYATLLDMWVPFADTLPTLRTLAGLGVRTVVLSNAGIDVRPILRRTGIADLVDAVVLSCEHGAVKPDPELFHRALAVVGTPPERAIMVGDNWRDDGAAAALGVRTVILPSRLGDGHGLRAVPGLVTGDPGNATQSNLPTRSIS